MISKTFLLIGAIALSLSVYHFTKSGEDEIRQLWSAWKSQYGVMYDSIDDQYRFQVFMENYFLIQKHNSEGHSYRMTINKFANLTNDEFKSIYSSGKLYDEKAVDKNCPSAVDCPSFPSTNMTSQNWTAKGAVTPVKDQGQCGSCWSFSTTGSLEGLYYLNTGKLLSFSEQQLVDCDKVDAGCNGGEDYTGMTYAAQNGLETETEYPYHGVDEDCNYNKSLAVHTNDGYLCVPQKSVSDLQGAGEHQPVSVDVMASGHAWQFYAGGVVDRNCGDNLDHAVLLTGWGVYEGQKAWYVKNSWGSDWGVNGYIYISQIYENSGPLQYGVCGILRCATVATPLNSKTH